MYLLDTNTVIYFFKGLGNVAETMFSKSLREIALSTITLYELERGIVKSTHPEKQARQLQSFTDRIAVLPFASKEAEASAKIRAKLEKMGTPIGPLDNFIAGTALCRNTVLVTHNTKEFQRIEGISLEDWF